MHCNRPLQTAILIAILDELDSRKGLLDEYNNLDGATHAEVNDALLRVIKEVLDNYETNYKSTC